MQTRLIALSLGVGALLLATQHAFAQGQQNCAVREQIVAFLTEKYGEQRQSIGLGANNSVVETYASADTGTWTIVVTMPNGVSCLVASGQAFERLADEPAKAAGSDA